MMLSPTTSIEEMKQQNDIMTDVLFNADDGIVAGEDYKKVQYASK